MKVRKNRSVLGICLSLLAVMAMLSVTACDNTGSSPTATTAPVAATTALTKAAAATIPAAGRTPAAGATAAAPAGTPAATGAKKELKIGVIAPMSGSGAAFGQALDKGVRMAAQEVNDKGGVKVGADTYTINVITYDDKYTGDGAVSAATRLINEDKVKFIIGSIGSAPVLAMQSVTEPAQVLLLPNSHAHEVVAPNKPFTARIVMTSLEYASVNYEWLKKNHPNIKSVAVFSPNDASGKAVSKDAIDAAKAIGLNVLADEYVERTTTDFYPLATKILTKNPDLIDTAAADPGMLGMFLKQVKELGYKGFTMSTTGCDVNDLLKLAGDAAEGHVCPTTDQNDPEVKAFADRYNKAHPGETFNSIAISFYFPAAALFQAMTQAGSLDPAKVRDTLVANKWLGAGGPFVFGGKKAYGLGQQFFGTSWISQMKGGKQIIIQKFDGTTLAN